MAEAAVELPKTLGETATPGSNRYYASPQLTCFLFVAVLTCCSVGFIEWLTCQHAIRKELMVVSANGSY